MAKIKRILFMTVGTGFGPDGNKKLANGIFSSIRNVRPDFVVFFPSLGSFETIKYVKELAQKEYGEFEEGEDYQIVVLNNIDDFNECFDIYEEEFLSFKDNNEIFIDYTSGTKTMSAAMAAVGLFYRVTLIAVAGERKDGVVVQGTESIKTNNLYKIFDKMVLKDVKKLFNSYRFTSAISFLEDIVDPNLHKEEYINLSYAYYYWDNVDFDKAYDYLLKVDKSFDDFKIMEKQLDLNLNALGNICNSYSENLKNCYRVASLINNAMRRADEFKYDDAIARLYRAFELIGQKKLEQYGIDSSNIDLEILKNKNVNEDFIDSLEKIRDDDGKIKIGLVKDFKLLNELNDKLGVFFIENESCINNLTKNRNESILAHGLISQNKDNYDQFEELIVKFAKKFDKDMKKFLKETSFAKFETD